LRYLITGDFQINERNRIKDYVKQLNVIEEKSREIEYDYYINAGDVFEHKKPTPFELKIFANHLRNIKAKNKIIIVGNHDELSETLTNLDWLPDDIIVTKTFQITDNKNSIYFAHRTVSEAKTGLDWRLNEISYKVLQKETKADIIVLGHIHTPQIINEKNPLVFHPGSIERNTFGERNDNKYIWDLNITEKDTKLNKTKLDIKPMHYIIYNIDDKEITVNDKKVTVFDIKNSIVKVDIVGTKEKINKINYDKLLDKFSGAYKLDFNFIYSDSEVKEFKMNESVTIKSDVELLEDYAKEKELNSKLIKYGKKIINEFN